MAHALISNPRQFIRDLYSANVELDGLDERVTEHFNKVFSDSSTLAQIPALTASSGERSLPPAGSLVRFRAMVQDTGAGVEVYRAVGTKGEVLAYGLDDETNTESAGAFDDYANLRERQTFYLISVPGETAWVKEILDEASASLSVSALSLSDRSKPTANTVVDAKFPNPSEPHFGCVAKVYGKAAEQLKSTDVLEFVGILGETALPTPFDDLVNGDEQISAATSLPALHIVSVRAAPRAVAAASQVDSSTCLELRTELIEYLATALGGDTEAAEWTLLNLLARVHTRHPTGAALGALALNLALPIDFESPLSETVASLLPALSSLSLSIPILNSQSTKISPRNRNEDLESGALQVAHRTTVLVDMRDIKEGKLEDLGVKNLRNLATTITTQKLAYEFPYSSFELETDLGFIVLSEGKAIIPTDCVIYVQPLPSSTPLTTPSPAKLDEFRSFIFNQKASDFTIPEDMSEVIQNDFVQRRQKSVGGEGMTQEDLLFRLTAARLMALSMGKNSLDKESWIKTAELDERRKDRSPVTKSA